MGLSLLSLKFNTVASRLMGLSAPSTSTMAVDGTELVSGDNGFWSTFGQIILNQLSDIVSLVADTLIQLVYTIGRWSLVLIDFLFTFVRQFVGMNMDFDNVEDLAQGDIIFKFIFNENVLRIIRNLIIFGIVLLIIFSIIAIIKSEYDYVTQNSDNSKGKILANTMKSLFLMVLVPVVAIGSIIMSNAILKSLYLATSGGNTTMSMGTQIFIASSYDANAYRRYANNDLKIPITFNFDSINSNDVTTGYYTDGTVAEMEAAIKEFKNQSVWSRGFTTYLMFATNAFLNMTDLDDMDRAYEKNGKVSPYHDVYDEGIFTRKEQYYVMADVIEYALNKNRPIYFKTIEEVYESYEKIPANLRDEDYSSNPISKSGDKYSVAVQYLNDSYISKFTHEKGKTDEADGAVFVIALEKTIVVNEGKSNEKTYSYYYPLINGKNDFATDYYSGTGNVVIAKGLFEEGKNPTAIKEDDGVVQFYRDDMNIPMLADLFPKISYEMPEGSFEDLGTKLLKGAFTALTGVDISQFIPYVYFSVDFFHMFTKKSYVISDLNNGKMKIDYNFSSTDFDMKNVYKLGSFNIVIFLFACAILLGILLKLLFGVIYRVLDITMLAIMYPTVLSTLPLDDGERFKNWVKQFSTKLLSVYAVVVGMNLVLLLAPIVNRIDVFTKADFIGFTDGGNLSDWSAMATAAIYNKISDILFMLVAFSSIDPIIRILNDYAGENGSKDDKGKQAYSSKLLEDGDKAVNDLKNAGNRVGGVITGKVFIDAGKEIIDTATQMAMPGSHLVAGAAKSIQDKFDKHDTRKVMKGQLSQVLGNVDSATSKGSGSSSDKNNENDDKQNSDNNAQNNNQGEDEKTKAKEGLEDATETEQQKGFNDLKNTEVMKSGSEVSPGDANAENKGDANQNSETKGKGENTEKSNSQNGEGSTEKSSSDNTGDGVGAQNKNGATGDANANAETQSNGAGDANVETPGENGGNGEQFISGHVDSVNDPNFNYGALNDEETEPGAGIGSGSNISSEEEFQEIDPNEFNDEFGKKSVGRKAMGYTGGLAMRTVATTAKLTGRLTLAAGKLVVGITKTALKMATRFVKASWNSLVNLAKQRESGNGIDHAGAFIGVAGAMAQTLGVGVSGLTKTGLSFAKDVTKASAKAAGGFVGNVFYPLNRKVNVVNSGGDGYESTENGNADPNAETQNGEGETNNNTQSVENNNQTQENNNDNNNSKTDDANEKTESESSEEEKKKEDDDKPNEDESDKKNDDSNQNSNGNTQITNASEGGNGVNVIVNVNDNPSAYSVVDKKAKDAGVDISVTKSENDENDVDSTNNNPETPPENQNPENSTKNEQNQNNNGSNNGDGSKQ